MTRPFPRDLDHGVGLFIPVAGIENFLESLRRTTSRVRVAQVEPLACKPEAEEPVRNFNAEQPIRKPEVTQSAFVEPIEERVAFVMPILEAPSNKESGRSQTTDKVFSAGAGSIHL